MTKSYQQTAWQYTQTSTLLYLIGAPDAKISAQMRKNSYFRKEIDVSSRQIIYTENINGTKWP